MPDNSYKIEHLKKSFQSSKNGQMQIFEDLNMEIEKGKITAVLGPSGCGKSTLLAILAGFEGYESGNVPENKNMGVVFQTPALFPWLTVEENIAYGLKRHGIKKTERRKQIEKYLKLVQLNEYAGLYPRELSGGMQQRAALREHLCFIRKFC